MAAPTPRPAALKLLNGRSPGRDSGGRPVTPPPAFTRDTPEPPGWLDGEGRAEWDRVTGGLGRLDVLKPEDRAALATYCEVWSRFVAAVTQYRAEGITIETGKGMTRKHPAVGVAEVAASQLRAFAAEFGLTPSAEQRLSVAPAEGDGDDPFAG